MLLLDTAGGEICTSGGEFYTSGGFFYLGTTTSGGKTLSVQFARTKIWRNLGASTHRMIVFTYVKPGMVKMFLPPNF